jgi:hypothetical protein
MTYGTWTIEGRNRFDKAVDTMAGLIGRRRERVKAAGEKLEPVVVIEKDVTVPRRPEVIEGLGVEARG